MEDGGQSKQGAKHAHWFTAAPKITSVGRSELVSVLILTEFKKMVNRSN